MKFRMMKQVVCALVLMSSSIGVAASTPKSVFLTSRYTGGTYQTASYSFRHMSQDIEITHNNMEVLYEGSVDSTDEFVVNTVTDDRSYIYDLGPMSCKNVDMKKADVSGRDFYPVRDRRFRIIGTERTRVFKGHCYLTNNNDGNGHVVTLFHVKSHTPGYDVTIDEIDLIENVVR